MEQITFVLRTPDETLDRLLWGLLRKESAIDSERLVEEIVASKLIDDYTIA